jgi:hypothetical protein
MTYQIYADYHYPTVMFAVRGDEGYVVPATPDGWERKRPWKPLARVTTVANRVTFFGKSWVAELTLGIPADEVEVLTPAEYNALW